MEKVYYNRPNFLGSEVGLVLKTITVPANHGSVVTEGNRKIVKAGTLFSTPYYGILFQDVDVTDGKALGSLMIAGRYIDANLPSTASSYSASFIAQGLFPIVEGSIVRPDFGSGSLSAIGTPSVSVSDSTISWASISGAVGYTIYDSNKNYITATSSVSYDASAVGTYYIQANADNITNASSALASATVVSLG